MAQVSIGVGTPAQPVWLAFDTGLPFLFTNDEESTACLALRFEPNASSSISAPTQRESFSYGQGLCRRPACH